MQGFRNFSHVHICPNSHFNLFYGLNGSGKTSLLEGIYLLGFGRSFRSPHLNTLIHHESPAFSTFTQVTHNPANIHSIGLEKYRQGRLKLKVDGEAVSSFSQMAVFCPVQIVCPDSFQLLTAGPQARRQFLDWGVFHVEHSFFGAWLNYIRALSQRNSLLRSPQIVFHYPFGMRSSSGGVRYSRIIGSLCG